jgi:protease I
VTHALENVRVAFVAANEGTEEAELVRPWLAVAIAGGRPEVVAPLLGVVETVRHVASAAGERMPVDQTTELACAEDYDAAVLPGGVVNPDPLGTDAAAVDFLMAMFEASKPVAAVCYGSLTLIEGDLVSGRTVTSSPGIRGDLRRARAHWVDEPVVVCTKGINTLVTGRGRDQTDLGAFCTRIASAFALPVGRPGASPPVVPLP